MRFTTVSTLDCFTRLLDLLSAVGVIIVEKNINKKINIDIKKINL